MSTRYICFCGEIYNKSMINDFWLKKKVPSLVLYNIVPGKTFFYKTSMAIFLISPQKNMMLVLIIREVLLMSSCSVCF